MISRVMVARRFLVTLVVAAGVSCAPPQSARERREANALLDREVYRSRVPELDAPLTLRTALTLAAEHNAEVWVAELEREFQRELVTQSRFKMLPQLLANTDVSDRSKLDAASSVSLESGEETLEPSYSSERMRRAFDVSVAWNLLDFGISYLRTQQQGNRELIALARECRVRQNLAFEVTEAYWEAVAARAVARDAKMLADEVEDTLERLQAESEDGAISQIEALSRETMLLEQLDALRSYERDFLRAKVRLGHLVGLQPGADYEIAGVDIDADVELPEFEIEDLEWEALVNRPELWEKDYEEAITRDEARVALLEMLPSPVGFWQVNYDSNRYLAFNRWHTAGLRVSWDLFTIPYQLAEHNVLQLESELIVRRRMAIAAAVLTQLHLSLVDYHEAREQHEFSRKLAEKRAALAKAIEAKQEEGKSHGGETLEHQMRALRSRARYLTARGDLLVAQARVVNVVGRDAREHGDVAEQVEILEVEGGTRFATAGPHAKVEHGSNGLGGVVGDE